MTRIYPGYSFIQYSYRKGFLYAVFRFLSNRAPLCHHAYQEVISSQGNLHE
jgi:hypothetical protein